MEKSSKQSSIFHPCATPKQTDCNSLRCGGGMDAILGFAEAAEEERIVSNGFLDQLFEQEQLGTVDDRMHALLEGLHRCEGLKGFAKQDDRRVASLVHGHGLERLQGEVFVERVGGEQFLDDDDRVTNLAEAHEEVTVRCGRMDLVAEFGQRRTR